MATPIEEVLVIIAAVVLRDLILARTYGIENDICVGLTKETTDAEFNSCIYELCTLLSNTKTCTNEFSDIEASLLNLKEVISSLSGLYAGVELDL